jgi:hypothetical protein
MPRQSFQVSQPGFIVDYQSIVLNSGRQIDWANVAAGFVDATTGKKVLPAGTVVGELLGGGKVSPRVVTTNPATGILAAQALEGDLDAALSGYGVIVGGRLYENLLPDATGGPPATLAAAIKTELGTNSHGFSFETYSDDRS